MKTKTNLYFLLILISASLWGTAGLFVRTVSKYGLEEMQLVLLRALFSAVTIGIALLIKDKSLFKVKLKDLWLFIAAALMSIVLFNFCYYKTMALTSLSVAAVLLYTAPFFVVILAPFVFKQAITIKKCFACAMAFLGCLFVTGVIGSGEKITGMALLFGILTGFGYSLYTVFSRILLNRGYSSLTITFYTFLFALIGCLPLADIKGGINLCVNSPIVILVSFLMSIINTVIPYLLYTAGLNGVDPSAAPIIAMIEPVVATLIGVAVYSEPLTLTGAFGIVLVFASVIILNLKSKTVKIKANAKINLSLSVLGKRDDGYHEMDTVMQSISLYDNVTIKKAKGITVKCGAMSGEDNIAFKAASLFFKETGISGGAEIKIKKNIPPAAGLGGGSSDAAAVLVGLDILYNTDLSYEKLLELAVTLGADVPFLVKGGTARARGIGEKLEPLKDFKNCYILIAKADNKPSTGEMFKRLDSIDYIKPDIKKTVTAINNEDNNALLSTLENSFYSLWQNTELEERLIKTGADAVALSGSGPSFFAVFFEKSKAKKAENQLNQEGITCFLCEPIQKALEIK